ncbi:MAG: ABC transporter permease [Dehalococcoidia bacterium]|nr:ABC transporter permease [Dehalococcoidia bacterium]
MIALNAIRHQQIFKAPWLRQLLFALLLLFDAYFGAIYNLGFVAGSGLFSGQFKWIVLSVEMMASGLILVRILVNQSPPKWKSPIIILTPILVGLIAFIVLEVLVSGLNRSATMNFNLSSILFSGLYWSAVYLSIAIGLTLTYKVQRFANFAQAEMMLVGSYVALTLMWSDSFFSISDAPVDGNINWTLLIWASICAFVVTGFAGLLIDRLVFRRLRNKAATPQVMMIASLGVSMVLRAVLFMRFSASTFRFVPDRDWRLTTSIVDIPTGLLKLNLGDRVTKPLMEFSANVDPYGFAYSKIALVLGIFLAVIFLILLLQKTRLGRQMRAVADNPDLAASSGIHLEHVHRSTSFLSAGIAGFGGSLLAGILPINPELGLMLLLPAFAVIVLGSIGSIPGVLIGALIVGGLRAFSEPVLIGAGNALDRPTASGFAEVMPFIFLVGLLLLAPRGIGSAIENWNIDRIRKRRMKEEITTLPVDPVGKEFTSRISARNKNPIHYFELTAERINTTIQLSKRSTAQSWNFINHHMLRMAKISEPVFAFIDSLFSVLRSKIGSLFSVRRDTERGSWTLFAILFLVLLTIVLLLPSVSVLTKTLQVARIFTLVGIFGLAAFSLNLHTGITGMTNFGVIFFVGIGAVVVGLLSAPVETNGYGWNPIAATIAAVIIAAIAGWLLAYPTARLRMDYFAILTISLAEILRISLQAEPLLRAGTVTSGIGISQFARPFEDWWNGSPSEAVGNLIGLPGNAPYVVLLAFMAIGFTAGVWYLLNTILSSPWGRILRSIREDEAVSQHHGHNVLIHKAASLALGAAIAALAGALWAWLNTNIWPDFMNPVRTTFLIWAAYIVGGRGNNRGMIIGAFIIVIVEFVFNVMVVSRGSASLPFHGLTSFLDSVFSWLMINVGGLVWSDRSVNEIFAHGNVLLSLPHLKLALVGLVIISALLMSSRGLLPEVASRPKRPALVGGVLDGDALSNSSAEGQNQLQNFEGKGK